MGFLDKIKDKAAQIKEENRNLGSTTRRINNKDNFYGTVNRGIQDGDFHCGSYVSIEAGRGVIYGGNQDDYTFSKDDVFCITPNGQGNVVFKEESLCYYVEFKDGKTAVMDIIKSKKDAFLAAFGD